MSRHLLLDRPDRQIVLGYDRMLVAFFGQVFRQDDPDREGEAIDGWPTKSGLGCRRPVANRRQMADDLAALTEWAKAQISEVYETEPAAALHLGWLIGTLCREWVEGEYAAEVPLPSCLGGARR